MTTHDEYRAALVEYRAAQRLFDQAEPDRVDEAVYRLRAAELRLGAAILALKEEQRAG
ncbi:hypothetical protein [Thermobacillus sp.]|uniref:hypothetical protein n=1 Tax=Thermobacillus sp. TaxID=2108467 RepID=UPI00257A22C1|nr:hypothetical protein [Thermobacillus sp.]